MEHSTAYYFLGRPESIRHVPAKSNSSQPDPCVVCFDWLTRVASEEAGIRAVSIDERISFEGGQELDRFVYGLLDSWYTVDGEDFSRFRGVSLGSLFHGFLLVNHFVPAMKMLEGCLLLLEKQHVRAIWTDFDEESNQYRVLSAVVATKRLPLGRIGYAAEPLFSARLLPDQTSFRSSRLARQGLWAIARISRWLKPRSTAAPRVLMGTYFTFVPLLENWARTPVDGLEFEFMDCPKRTLALRLAWVGFDFSAPQEASLSVEERATVARIQSTWQAAKRNAEYRSRFIWSGIDLFGVFEPILDRITAERIPRAARMVAGCFNYLERHKILGVILPAELGENYGVLVQCAKILRIPTVILFHGLLTGPCPSYYAPVYKRQADKIVVWSDQLAKKFENEFGIPGEEIVVSPGYPYLLKYIDQDGLADLDGDLILVLANTRLNPFCFGGELEPAEYLLKVLDVITGTCPTYPVLVRLHPGDLRSYYERLLRNMASLFPMLRITLSRGGPIKDELRRSRVILGFNTAVAFEAAALGKPYIHVNLNKWEAGPPFDGKSSLRIVRDTVSLARELSDVFTGASESYHHWAREFLLDWAGGIVPDSAQHVARAIRELVQPVESS